MASDTPSAFFSYSRTDSEFVLRLAADLKAAGASVWLDQLDIVPGQRWARAVEEALNNSARLLVILSPESAASTNVQDEVNFALEEKKTIIPVFHKDCKVPFQLRPFQYVDFRTDYARGLQVMIKTLDAKQQTATSAAAASTVSAGSKADVAEEAAPQTRAAAKEIVQGEQQRQAEEERAREEQARKAAAEKARLEQEERERQAEQARLAQEQRAREELGRKAAVEKEQLLWQEQHDATLPIAAAERQTAEWRPVQPTLKNVGPPPAQSAKRSFVMSVLFPESAWGKALAVGIVWSIWGNLLWHLRVPVIAYWPGWWYGPRWGGAFLMGLGLGLTLANYLGWTTSRSHWRYAGVLGVTWSAVAGVSSFLGGPWLHSLVTYSAFHAARGLIFGAVTVCLLRRTPKFLFTKPGAIIVTGYVASEVVSAQIFLSGMRMYGNPTWSIGVSLLVGGIIGSGVMFWQLSRATTSGYEIGTAD